MTLKFSIDGLQISQECSPHLRLSELLSEFDALDCSVGVYRTQDGRTVLAEHELAIRCHGLDLSPVPLGDLPEEVPALTAVEVMSLEASSGRPSA